MEVPKYLIVSEVAQILRVPEDNVRNLAATNKIPAIKIGNLWRFNESKLLKYIERKYCNDYSD